MSTGADGTATDAAPARVLVLASTFPRWEGDSMPPFIRHLGDALAARGFEIHVLAPHASGAAREERLGALLVHRFRYAPQRFEQLAYGGGILENLRARRARWLLVVPFLLAQAVAMLRLCRDCRINLVHAHWILPQGLLSALFGPRLAVPLVLSAHGGDVFASARGLRRHLLGFATRRHDAVTVNSQAMCQALEALTGHAGEIIPMGVDVARFAVEARCPRANTAPPRLLFVGRLAEKKGVDYLLAAMPTILERHPGASLDVVGDGPRRGMLEAQVRSLGIVAAVHFHGACDNAALPRYYAAADLFVAPSIVADDGDTEALGVVLLEAGAAGLPLVTTDVGGIGDIVSDGVTGLVVPQRSAAALANAVCSLIDDPNRAFELGRAAHAHVCRHFDWTAVAERFAALYARLLARAGNGPA